MLSDSGSSGPLFTVGSVPALLEAVAAQRSAELSPLIA
jgi:hypothetical protein